MLLEIRLHATLFFFKFLFFEHENQRKKIKVAFSQKSSMIFEYWNYSFVIMQVIKLVV